MKKITSLAFMSIICLSLGAQNFTPKGGEFIHNSKNVECLTNDQRNSIINMLQENQRRLTLENRRSFSEENRGSIVFYAWPVAKSAGSNYESIWGISNYVDHNSAFPNQLSDFNCGTRTYDTNSGYNHRGIDIYTWPFSWKIMDNDEAEILAAAPGQIIAKSDGNFDRSCSLNGGNWNAVFVEHSDGTIAWYGHMKNGSLTTKGVGDMVAEGEFLGVIGSSGNSTGPHLHFEVWEDDTYTQLLDPYAGPCNTLNPGTRWQSQKPYLNPNINAVLTHSAPPVFPGCPTTETTNESDDFELSDTIYFAIYMRDQMDMTSINLKIIRPDDSVLYDWNFDFTANYYSSYWYWYYTGVFDQEGVWKWQASYQGQTVTHTLDIGDTLSINDNELANTKVFPNPFQDKIVINSASRIIEAKLFDISGKEVLSVKDNIQGITAVSSENLSNGMYFLNLKNDKNQERTLKVLKE